MNSSYGYAQRIDDLETEVRMLRDALEEALAERDHARELAVAFEAELSRQFHQARRD